MIKLLLIHVILFICHPSLANGLIPTPITPERDTAVSRIRRLQATSQKLNARRSDDVRNQQHAIKYAKTAVILSDKNHVPLLKTESFCLIAEAFLRLQNKEAGKSYFLQAVQNCRNLKDRKAEAVTWLRMGVKLSYYQLLDEQTLGYEQNALNIFFNSNDQNGLVDVYQSKGAIFEKLGLLDSADHVLSAATAIADRINRKDRFLLYRSLATYNDQKGNVVRALEYYQKALQNLKDTHKPLSSVFYGNTCSSIGILLFENRKECYKYLDLAIKYLKCSDEELSGYYLFSAYQTLCMRLIEDEKVTEAFNTIRALLKSYPPVSDLERAQANSCLATCYESMNKYELAESHYQKAISYYHRYPKQQAEANAALMRFYSETKQFGKLQKGLQAKLSPADADALTFNNKVFFELQQFQLDSAKGDFQSALGHLRNSQRFNDSLASSTKSKQLNELQLKYETKEKEQSIRLLEDQAQKAILERNIKEGEYQKIRLLQNVQEVQLQKLNLQRNIEATKIKNLMYQQKVQQAFLRQSILERKMMLGGLGMLIVILILAYYGYRNKSRNNRLLIDQQKEINSQNLNLETLLKEQEKLLTEKDWLLKEVHHRVKNNLHMISSLLESQSAYLENEALFAVQKSQHRVQAISILHQKLYLADHTTTVSAKEYLTEIANYLKETFDGDSKVRFDLDIEDIQIDVSQAVPLGLIVNEAITNVLKYAFPGRSGGTVSIRFKLNAEGKCVLNISDNGRGLPGDFDLNRNSSLGLTLIKGLAKNMGAAFVLQSLAGTHISVIYKYINLYQVPAEQVFA